MLRNSCYLTALIALMSTLIAVLARSQTIAPTREAQTTGEQPFSPTMPICYIQLENGQLRDLRSVCGKKATGSVPARGVQTLSQPDDDDDDDNAPTSTPSPRSTPSQIPPASTSTPARPVPQATSSPATIQSPSVTPTPSVVPTPSATPTPSVTPTSVAPTSTSNPLAIPEDKPSRD